MKRDPYHIMPKLFFNTRQLMRSKVRSAGKTDPNAWMRFEALRFISECGDCTMHDIARYLRITPPSATSLVAGLIRHKFVNRAADKKDKRVQRITMSVNGKKHLRKYLDHSAVLMTEVFGRLPKKDVEALAQILEALDNEHRE